MKKERDYKYPDPNIAERFRECLDYFGINAVQLGKYLRLERKTVYYKRDAVTPFTADEIMWFCLRYGVDANWLLLGRGLSPWEKDRQRRERMKQNAV